MNIIVIGVQWHANCGCTLVGNAHVLECDHVHILLRVRKVHVDQLLSALAEPVDSVQEIPWHNHCDRFSNE